MNIIVVGHEAGEKELYSDYVVGQGHTAFMATTSTEAVGILLNHSHTLCPVFDALLVNLKAGGWSSGPREGWPGLWLFGYLQRLRIILPCLAHCDSTECESHNLFELPTKYPFVTFAQKRGNLDYIDMFLQGIKR